MDDTLRAAADTIATEAAADTIAEQATAQVATGQVGSPEGGAALPAAQQAAFDAAVAAERAGRLDEAERLLAGLLAAAPQQPEALHLAGIVLFRQGRRVDALRLMRQAASLGLDTPLAWRNLCELLRVQGHLDEAMAAGQRAVGQAPADPRAWHNLATVHAERLELEEAEGCERRALSLSPDYAQAHFGLSETLLLQGRLEEGWEQYRWRFNLPAGQPNLPPGGGPVWDGRRLPAGRLLVVADQGYGDAIQFGRYLPWVLERCPEVLVAGGAPLRPVLAQLGAKRLFHRWADVPEHDAWIPLSGLPRLAGTRLDSIPAAIPYLRALPVDVEAWRRRLDRLLPAGVRRVGLAWAGRPTHANDHRRSTRLDRLGPLLEMAGVGFVSLQKDERAGDVGRYFGGAPLVNLAPELRDWNDTMAVIAGLDAVVTVDTAVAHLAGALGRPTHLMLPHAAEWRWLLRRGDSPWYPTMRLHRQAVPDAWEDVAGAVRQALEGAQA